MVFTFFKIPIIRLIKPILPKNIKKITTYFPGSLSSGVIPKDKPTVLKAENTSKAISKSVNCGLKISNNKIPKPIEANEIEIIANALKTDSLATLLVPISIFDLSLAIEKIFNVAIAKVVVLIPPPVEAGEAPIHIKKIINKIPGTVKLLISIVLKPAVLEVTDENIAVVNFPNTVLCSLKKVSCSEIRKKPVPTTINKMVV